MVEVKDLTELTVRDLWREVKGEDDWWVETGERTRRLVKRFLEGALQEEIMEELRVDRYRRDRLRRGYRNGYRYRSLLTEFGLLSEIRVPRDREGIYQTKLLERYQRRQARVNGMVREMFLSGVSTRRVEEVLEPLLGAPLSAQSVSRITRILDGEVRSFHERRLADDHTILFLDGITLKVKGAAGVQTRLVLCAYSINSCGVRELVSFRLATSESEAQWEGFLNDLYRRGLEGKQLRLIATDGCAGLHRALDTVYPYVKRQRCWAHKLRNLGAKLRRRNQAACLAEVKTIYQADTRREAIRRFKTWAARWRQAEPKAVKCLTDDLEEMLAFLACPASQRKKVRTTNAIERAFREVRRRTRPMSCFQNPASVDRIIYGVISHLNDKWKEKPLSQFTHNT